MPIAKIRIQNFKAFEDSGIITVGPIMAIVGPNDVGKSCILHALSLFFTPPRTGGLPIEYLHQKDINRIASIEIGFIPSQLQSTNILIDARNQLDINEDYLLDDSDLFRLRIKISHRRIESFEILIRDIDVDDAFPLALKNQNELLTLLENRGLEAIRAGQETNKEKRDSIRSYEERAGTTYRTEWVNADQHKKQIRALLPEFIFFTDSADYGIGVTSVQNQFKGVVHRALEENQEAILIEERIRVTLQEEFNKIQTHLQGLTGSVRSLSANPNISWKKAVDKIDLLLSDEHELELPFESRGAGIRRLFMVAYFEYEAAETLRDQNGPKYIYAIEEPEVHLHPGAQRALELSLRGLSALGHAIIYTTHSPVFASASSIDDLVLIQRQASLSVPIQTPNLDIDQVATDIGVEASDRLVGKNHIILVEGSGDVEFYTEILRSLFVAGILNLNPELIMFLQCGGITNLKFMVTTQCLEEAHLIWGVIADSDRQTQGGPLGQNTDRLVNQCPATCSSLHVLERTCIENYLDPAAIQSVTGIACQIPMFGPILDLRGSPLPDRQLKTIKRSLAQIVHQMGPTEIQAFSLDSNGNSEWISIFNQIQVDFGNLGL